MNPLALRRATFSASFALLLALFLCELRAARAAEPLGEGAPSAVTTTLGQQFAAEGGAQALEVPEIQPPQKQPSTRDLVIFWSIGGLVLLGAIAMVTRRNPVVAVMCLVGTFLALSMVYVLLLAHFLAAIQVLVYAGAIMVLFVFVVMIINREETEAWQLSWSNWIGRGIGVLASLYIVVRFLMVLGPSTKALGLTDQWTPAELAKFGTTREMGGLLFTKYLFPFEAVTLLLLIAVVGALVLARPKDAPEEGDSTGQAHSLDKATIEARTHATHSDHDDQADHSGHAAKGSSHA